MTMTFKKVSDPYAVRNHYISEGAFIERPSSPTPFKIEAGYRIEGCLPSTTILIEDVLSGDLVLEAMIEENEDDFLEFTFEDVGNYRVMVKSPLPHRESVMIIAEELS